jgi:hypothetical protein
LDLSNKLKIDNLQQYYLWLYMFIVRDCYEYYN